MGWFFTAKEIADTISNGHMLNPSLDLTNACNLNCPYCYIEEKDSRRKIRKPDELTHDEVLTAIDEFKSCGARTINLVGAGEPTIDPHFEETIEHIHSQGLHTVLFTNGIRLANERQLVPFLLRHQVSVVLKYNSQTADVEDLAAGRHGYSLKRDVALEFLFDAGFASDEPTRLGIDTIAFAGNLNEIAPIHSWCRAHNIFPICGEYIPTGRTDGGQFQGFSCLHNLSDTDQQRAISLLHSISAADRNALVKELATLDAQHSVSRPERFAYFGGGICTQILGLYLDIQGNIWPCVARNQDGCGSAKSPLGNFRQGDKLRTIWTDHKYMKHVRATFSGGCPYKAPLTTIHM